MVGEAKRLEDAGAALLNFTNSGPVVGAAVAQAVSIPVVGGFGGGPWLDGRMRMATAAIGYSADALDDPPDTYANVAQIALDAITAYADDVRAARQIAGGIRQVSVPTAVDRRDRHPVRGGGLRPAAADVLAGWIRRHAGQLADSRAVSPHADCWRSCGNGSPASPSTGASPASRAAGSSGVSLVGLRQPGRRAARPSRPGTAHTDGRLRRLLDGGRFRRRSPRIECPAWCCTRRPAA